MKSNAEMIEIFEDNLIEYEITESGNLLAKHQMTTCFGDDCSDWVSGTEMIDHLKANNII